MYSHVFVGGTFDRLHKGHDMFLSRAYEAGDRVVIGLTSDEFIKNFRTQQNISPFAKRKINLEGWISAHDFGGRTDVIAIDDPYEPAASMNDLDAIMVTPDNRSRGEEINRRRVHKGLPELDLVEVPLSAAQDNQPISSSRIRLGVIDVEGRLIMPDNLRPELVRPLGTVLAGDKIGSSFESHRTDVIISVGDITTKNLLTAGVVPNLSIVDFQVGRKPYPDLDAKFTQLNLYRVVVVSGPGYIAKEAITLIEKWATSPENREAIVVSGEEDLIALPAVAYAPAGTVVYYGQPGEGLVEVIINDQKKKEAIALLSRFDVK